MIISNADLYICDAQLVPKEDIHSMVEKGRWCRTQDDGGLTKQALL